MTKKELDYIGVSRVAWPQYWAELDGVSESRAAI